MSTTKFVFNDENELLSLLSRNEKLKNEDNWHYYPKTNNLWEEVALIWDLNTDFVECYREDYQRLENMFDKEMEQTCWANKYSMVVLKPEISDEYKELLISQPIPDYVTWHKSSGELHFLPLEKLNQLNTDVIDATPGIFLPSNILDKSFKLFKHDVDTIITIISFFLQKMR